MTYIITNTVVEAIEEILPKNKTILELGTGIGTKKLTKNYNVLSVEHNSKFHVAESELLNVSLKQVNIDTQAFWSRFPIEDVSAWYDPAKLREILKDRKYDLLLIDGPAGGASRAAMWYWYPFLFDTAVPVIVDDIHRKNEYKVARKICSIKNVNNIEIRDMLNRKQFGIIR